MNARLAMLGVLALAVVVSAVSVVYVTHRSRVLFGDLRALETERDRLHAQWSRLAIERGSSGTHDRIEGLARRQLGFVEPGPEHIEVVSAP